MEVDETGFSVRGLTKYNGDHDWTCRVDIVGCSYDDLQTYVRGENVHRVLTCVVNVTVTVSISAPNFTPTNLTVLH